MNTESRKDSIIVQVALLFVIGAMVAGLLTYVSQYAFSDNLVRTQMESDASELANEVVMSVREYPAHEWLMRYWYEHAYDLDIEYDADFSADTKTAEKLRTMREHCPGLMLQYAGTDEILAMTPEDQKLYAEITYSWMITRLNKIKRSHNIDFLFCVISDPTCRTQFFLFSAADENAVRGKNYEQVYPLGMTTVVSESLRDAMREAWRNNAHLADAGDYEDYYAYMCMLDEAPVFIGMTYNTSGIGNVIARQTARGTALAVAQQTCLALICLFLIYYFVLLPLKKVQGNIRLYQKTKDSRIVLDNLAEVRPHNEIGQLSEDVSALAAEMDNYMNSIRVITAEKERIGTELTLATRIQENALPHTFPPFPDRPEIDLYAVMDPAREIGGDFYDFFMIDEDHLCILIADVSGKGIPAALFMMASKIVLDMNARQHRSPAEIMNATNDIICANNPEGMFVTVWLGVLELSSGKLTAANAGHEYPFLTGEDGKYRLVKAKHGFVVGGMPGLKYREYEIQLRKNARVFLYSDGLAEATDPENCLFGTDRILEALNRDVNAGPKQVLENVRADVDAFVKDAEQFDDLTMVCLEYRGSDRQTAPVN